MKNTSTLALFLALAMTMFISACGESAEEAAARMERERLAAEAIRTAEEAMISGEAAEQESIQEEAVAAEPEVAEQEAMLNFDGDRLAGTPFHETSGAYIHHCDSGVASQGILDAAFAVINATAELHNLPKAERSPCVVYEGKSSDWMAQTIDITYYVNESDMKSCLYNDYCVNTRQMNIMALRDGLYGNVFVSSEDGRFYKMACFDLMSGTHVANEGCVEAIQ